MFSFIARADGTLVDQYCYYLHLSLHQAWFPKRARPTTFGHSHRHRVRELTGTGGSFFEVMTSALMDYPQQVRLIEVSDLDNGFFSISCTSVDYESDDDALAAEGRELAILDQATGWGDEAAEEPGDGNVRLFIPAPSFE